MAVQQFCLRWNNHQPNFISVFSSLLNSESLVDVTLAAEGRHLQAHKVVLSACSSYFQSLFMVNPCQHPIVILKDVKFMDLKIMVDFMYYGEVNVSQEQLPHILKTAEMLKIKGLAEMPDSTSLTKSQNNSTEKTDLLTPGESNWSSDGQRLSSSPSLCPLSPGSRRKRLRKSSSGSGSASTERTSEDQQGDLTSPSGNVTGIVAKTEPNSSFSSEGSVSHISTLKQHSSESEIIRNNSQENIEEERHTQQSAPTRTHVGLQMPQPEIQTVVQQPIENPILDLPDPSSSGTACVQQTPVHQGVQWTLVEHTYPPRFALSSSEGTGLTSQTMQYMPTSGSLSSCAMAGESFQSPQAPAAAPASPCPSVCPSPSCPSPNSTPSTPQPPTNTRRKRSINPQADENFVRALEAVRFGGIGFCKAARMFGVNNRTLWLEYKKRGYPNTRPSIKNRVKQECQTTPSPKSSPNSSSIDVNDQQQQQQQQHQQNQQTVPSSSTVATHTTQQSHLMCPPATSHAMTGVLGSFLDARHVEFSTGMQRAPVLTTQQTHINLHGIHFNSI